jgi:phage/plasmid primase-like uncharacterized protein
MADLTSIFKGGFTALDKITLGSLDLARPEEAFRDEMKLRGLDVEYVSADGEIHRVPLINGKKNEKDAYYALHVDGPVPVGVYGSWKEPQFEAKWVADIGRAMTISEQAAQSKWFNELKAKREAARKQTQDEAAELAEELVGTLADASDEHPYLVSKGVKAHGIKIDRAGDLIIPFGNISGEMQSFQRIKPDGSKRYQKGGKREGGFFELRGDRKLVIICEGYATCATVHEATGATVFMAGDTSGLMWTAKAARELYPAARILIGADNDHATEGNPGLAKARLAARAINADVVYPEFSEADYAGQPKSCTDFNDLARVRGLDDVAQQIGLVTRHDTTSFKFVRVDGLELKEISWLVESYIEADSLAQVFGDPGCGKSFVAIDLACCVSTGTPWHGHEVTQGAVFYIAGEGHNGLARRFKAWELGTGASLDGAPLYKSQRAAMLYDASEAAIVAQAIEAMAKEAGHPAMIIIDTLARNMGGDENSTEDMNAFIAHLDLYFRQKWGCCVVIVHHSGAMDKDRSRGSTALRGAMDAEYKVELLPAGQVQFSGKKMKDAEIPKPLTFALTQVDLPLYDRFMQPIKGAYLVNQTADISAVVEQAVERQTGMGKNQQKALNVLAGLVMQRKKDGGGVVLVSEWREGCMKTMDRNQFWRAKNNLTEKGVIVILGHDEALQTVALQRNDDDATGVA